MCRRCSYYTTNDGYHQRATVVLIHDSSQGSADAQQAQQLRVQSLPEPATLVDALCARYGNRVRLLTNQKVSCFVSRSVKMSTTIANRWATDQSDVTNPMYSSYQEIRLDSAPQNVYTEVTPQPTVCTELKKEKEENPPDLREDCLSISPTDDERESQQWLFCLILLYCTTLLLFILSLTTLCLACLPWFGIAHFSTTTVLQTTPIPTQPSCRCTG